MALRLPLALFGLVELLAPRKVVDFWMDLAVSEDSEVELRPWVYTAARVEGILILLWVFTRARGDESDE
ncbi:hypothetical protein BV210_07990 [Halorientalis sp. IM1011]|uniref:hypothetical protein n=1 Tax=Halorientalis sp. IM1011 TaxID=1932360 RepID=UPI00097CCD93|nr:hypothetical protein [Halorientalis sp. IM1011]AQL42654.1 hypothetical protein BV210_07990 [Halorientalis sp. IM1011]